MNFKQHLKRYKHLKRISTKAYKGTQINPSSKAPISSTITIQYNQTIVMQSSAESKEDLSKYLTATFFNESNPSTLSEPVKYEHHAPLHTFTITKNPFVNRSTKRLRSASTIQMNQRTKESIKQQPRHSEAESTAKPQRESTASTAVCMLNRSSSTLIKGSNRSSYSRNDTILFFLCINCGNSIHKDDIERHSLKCVKVTEEVIKHDASPSRTISINYKLAKFKEHLENIINSKVRLAKEYEDEMKYIATILKHYIDDSIALDAMTVFSIKSLKEILKNLEAVGLGRHSLSSQVLIDRSKVLIREKANTLRESLKKKGNARLSLMESRIKKKMKDIEDIQLKTQLEKIKVKNLRKSSMPNLREHSLGSIEHLNQAEGNVDNDKDTIIQDELSDNEHQVNKGTKAFNEIDEIVSDIESNNQSVTDKSFASIMSEVSFDKASRSSVKKKGNLNQGKEKEEVMIFSKAMDNQDKKEFLKELLRVKFEKLHSTHKGMKIPQIMVWNECKSKRIPKEQWKEFILSELNNPDKYTEMSKSELKGVGCKKEFMTIIDEEKV